MAVNNFFEVLGEVSEPQGTGNGTPLPYKRSSCFGRVHETDPRVCQTRSLTICIQKGEEYLPLLKASPKQPKPATIQIRVEEDVKLRLEKYAEFSNSSPAYVVTEALKLLFKKD
jgi:hypothetical protein